jgi:uncharacterized protein YuzE
MLLPSFGGKLKPLPRNRGPLWAPFAVGTGHRCVVRFERGASAEYVIHFAMKIKYFQDTDTLYIEFGAGQTAETRDLDEDTLLELDERGNIYALTMEHASKRTDIPGFSYEQIAA